MQIAYSQLLAHSWLAYPNCKPASVQAILPERLVLPLQGCAPTVLRC